MASSLPILLTLSSLSTLSAAYTWNFASPPQQCSNLTVSLVGSGGVPPYRLLVLPSGPTPLSSGIEVRRILDVPFPDGSTTVSFQLKYPANSQLVAVVSITLSFLFPFFYFLHFLFLSFLFLFLLLSLSRAEALSDGFNGVVHLWTPPFTHPKLCFTIKEDFYVILLHAPHSIYDSLFGCHSNPLQPQNIFIIRFVTSACISYCLLEITPLSQGNTFMMDGGTPASARL